MPFCPKCKYEYRAGFTQCPDCDVELVDKLPDEQPEPEVELVAVASYPFDVPAQEAKIRLESEGIRAVLSNEVMAQTDIVLVFAGGGVKVLVRKEDAARAAEILEKD